MAMIFQEPMSSLNPCFTVGFQIREMLKQHGPSIGPGGSAGPSNSWVSSAFRSPSGG